MLRNIGQGSFHGEFSFFDPHGVDDPLVIELFQKEDSTPVICACITYRSFAVSHEVQQRSNKLISIFIFISQ